MGGGVAWRGVVRAVALNGHRQGHLSLSSKHCRDRRRTKEFETTNFLNLSVESFKQIHLWFTCCPKGFTSSTRLPYKFVPLWSFCVSHSVYAVFVIIVSFYLPVLHPWRLSEDSSCLLVVILLILIDSCHYVCRSKCPWGQGHFDPLGLCLIGPFIQYLYCRLYHH